MWHSDREEELSLFSVAMATQSELGLFLVITAPLSRQTTYAAHTLALTTANDIIMEKHYASSHHDCFQITTLKIKRCTTVRDVVLRSTINKLFNYNGSQPQGGCLDIGGCVLFGGGGK